MDRIEPAVDYMCITGRCWDLDTIAEVAQAVGMIADQLQCPPQAAEVILRGHAAAHALDLVEIALGVVHRELSFTP